MASRKSNVESLNYSRAYSILGSKEELKINHNTILEKVDDETIAVRLYHTRIVVYHSDGSIQLRTGGHRTVTTIARMNDALDGISIFIRNGDLLVSIKDDNTDATLFAIYEIREVANEEIDSLEDISRYVRSLTIKALKTIWRRCKYSRAVIAYYAPIVFIPLIVPRASGSEYWYRTGIALQRIAWQTGNLL
jgi:hypothetical protein